MPNPTTPRTKAEQRVLTRRALVESGRKLFSRDGYESVNVAAIAGAADVTTGAIYHHFGSKLGLFGAVLAEIHAEVATLIEAAIRGLDVWDQLVTGSQAFLEASNDPSRRRVMLVEGPAVLGWETWRELDAATSLKLLEDVLGELIDRGDIPAQPIRPLAHLLSGAMNEAALWLATSADRPRDLEATNAALVRMLESLRVRS